MKGGSKGKSNNRNSWILYKFDEIQKKVYLSMDFEDESFKILTSKLPIVWEGDGKKGEVGNGESSKGNGSLVQSLVNG